MRVTGYILTFLGMMLPILAYFLDIGKGLGLDTLERLQAATSTFAAAARRRRSTHILMAVCYSALTFIFLFLASKEPQLNGVAGFAIGLNTILVLCLVFGYPVFVGMVGVLARVSSLTRSGESVRIAWTIHTLGAILAIGGLLLSWFAPK